MVCIYIPQLGQRWAIQSYVCTSIAACIMYRRPTHSEITTGPHSVDIPCINLDAQVFCDWHCWLVWLVMLSTNHRYNFKCSTSVGLWLLGLQYCRHIVVHDHSGFACMRMYISEEGTHEQAPTLSVLASCRHMTTLHCMDCVKQWQCAAMQFASVSDMDTCARGDPITWSRVHTVHFRG